jgi:hypothetical protein
LISRLRLRKVIRWKGNFTLAGFTLAGFTRERGRILRTNFMFAEFTRRDGLDKKQESIPSEKEV